ncbi:BREX-1 system adenine-specific DNA-methyltransferase PglX [Enterorhabdus sp. P55]|uniref:BREX-1 system adenine-specific DNA-methyltransferase PglX n=1 Tax=Enterorhabdus sp. P55 TaxID=2304571 RepID=UPI001370868D
MNDTAIKGFCIWARNELVSQVRQQALRWGIAPEAHVPADAASVGGRLLSDAERRQRADLLRMRDAQGYEALVERAAYTWFNRLTAIRFMELNDRLPCHVRLLSSEDGSFRPQVLREALDVRIEGLDEEGVAALVAAGDDEALFRMVLLAQCRELSACLPDVFEPVGAPLELLLPQGLLRSGSVIERLVDDIPEEDWRGGVEIVGWMYQYYISERKDEVFASFKKGKKADAGAIAPATQLFTPHWIVQYLTQNSLGRLWVQTRPESALPSQMPYYIPDDLGAEESDAASSTVAEASEKGLPRAPETITVIDPACGSGHILVYAFRLLAAMYEEAGYGRRDIPRLILRNNLTGCEIDPRAAQIASFALAMTACEWDSRFLRRDEKVRARVVYLRPAELSEEELGEMPYLAERTALLDAMAHMGECGSLFVPEPEDIVALRRADDELDAREAGGDLLAHHPHAMVARMLANCAPLAQTYDVVVANPPYMGGKNMNKWLSDWVKKNYPDVKGDLFSCFIQRNLDFAREGGQLGFMTPYVWMFIGTYEKLRNKIIEDATITSLVQLEYSGFAGATVPICTFTLQKGFVLRYRGGYVRLSDFVGAAKQAPKTLEAIANPSCGWFYRRSSDSFKSIPGTPIAYWASDAVLRAFAAHLPLLNVAVPRQGFATGENSRFLRSWWECKLNNSAVGDSGSRCSLRWFPCNKGGGFRKWYGNNEIVANWENDGAEMRGFKGSVIRNPSYYFKEGMTWGTISSADLSMRYSPRGFVFETKGSMCFAASHESLMKCLGFVNSSVVKSFQAILSPTLDFHEGPLGNLPLSDEVFFRIDSALVECCVEISRNDWDSFEASWDFLRHPMV